MSMPTAMRVICWVWVASLPSFQLLVICPHFNDCRPKCKWLIGGYICQIAAIYIVAQVGIHLGLCWVHYLFILHIQNVFNFHRQRISGQRSEPNNTVSEFHLSAVEGMLSWGLTAYKLNSPGENLPHPMLFYPEIISSISPDTSGKNFSCHKLWIKTFFFIN